MADLTAQAQATENKMEEVMETVSTHDTDIQELREQIPILEESNKHLNNRTRRNNIQVRELPETVSTELLPDSLTLAFQKPPARGLLLKDHAHRSLRAPSAISTTPRDVMVRMHYYHIKERLIQATRDNPVEVEDVQIRLYQDLAPNMLKR
ncbi:Hypothetical predicted protein [Pelobates cultripes]|uniref:Uncharacterized protein n=1 Tax=Pelobates cultripes TaxID=61616 RepID=A0AAD1RW86_PELCU|nr:Hypothetical predicted protein [Pelobates cultripes]